MTNLLAMAKPGGPRWSMDYRPHYKGYGKQQMGLLVVHFDVLIDLGFRIFLHIRIICRDIEVSYVKIRCRDIESGYKNTSVC